MENRKTVFDLKEIIKRCFNEAKKMNYVRESILKKDYDSDEEGKSVDIILSVDDLVDHITRTVIGELYELEIIRRIVPIFRENRALSADFQQFGDAFMLFYDKQIQEMQLKGMRLQEGEEKK